MAYVPPHRKGVPPIDGAPASPSSGFGSRKTSGYGSRSNSGYGSRSNSGYGSRNGSGYGGRSGGFGGNSPRQKRGEGKWVDGVHVPAERDAALELSLYGEEGDSKFQSSGINFDNYDDIPVEATGENVPEPVN